MMLRAPGCRKYDVSVMFWAQGKSLAPHDPDWIFKRAAAILRHLYLRPSCGVGAFRKVFSCKTGKKCSPGHTSKVSLLLTWVSAVPSSALEHLIHRFSCATQLLMCGPSRRTEPVQDRGTCVAVVPNQDGFLSTFAYDLARCFPAYLLCRPAGRSSVTFFSSLRPWALSSHGLTSEPFTCIKTAVLGLCAMHGQRAHAGGAPLCCAFMLRCRIPVVSCCSGRRLTKMGQKELDVIARQCVAPSKA